MDLFWQQLINGLTIGAVYGIFAIGFNLVFGTLNVLNLAQGSIATVGALAAVWSATALGVGFYLALLVGVLAAALVGGLVDELAFRPIRVRGGNPLAFIITSLGFWLVLDSLALVTTDARALVLPASGLEGVSVHLGSVLLRIENLAILLTFVVLAVSVHQFLGRTAHGSAVRAVGWNQGAAAISGVNSRVVLVSTSAAAGALCGLSGIAYGVTTNSVTWDLGSSLLLNGFAAVVVGGFGDVRGAALGGVLIGLSQVLSAQYVSGSFRDVITFGLLIVFLLFRPTGIFGRSAGVRA